MLDPEIEAMAKCHEQLEPLDINGKVRVIRWLISKYELNGQTSMVNGELARHDSPPIGAVKILPGDSRVTENEQTLIAVPQQDNAIESFESVADFFAATSPDTEWEKALVVATFLQVKQGFSDFTSFNINKELKNLGHGASHITNVIQACIDRKPQFILQLRKEGKTQQAQKKFKVSNEGIKYVKGMLQKTTN